MYANAPQGRKRIATYIYYMSNMREPVDLKLFLLR